VCATVVRPTLCGNRRRVLTMQPNPLDPVASERLSHAGKVFTSDLSINEFALLHGAGFEPIELVMGVSVYHVGYQFTGIKQQSELPVLTDATYRARWNAMSRMQAEADSLGADGVVGVRLDWRHQGEGEHLEFIAVGTAVRYTEKPGAFRRSTGQAFTSHLSGQDLTTLLRSGYSPVAFVRQGATPRCRSGHRAATRRASWRCRGCRPRRSETAETALSEYISPFRTMPGDITRSSFTSPEPPCAVTANRKPSHRHSSSR
jgi:uncharacterized protein YbjQ (UPF0145 family)